MLGKNANFISKMYFALLFKKRFEHLRRPGCSPGPLTRRPPYKPSHGEPRSPTPEKFLRALMCCHSLKLKLCLKFQNLFQICLNLGMRVYNQQKILNKVVKLMIGFSLTFLSSRGQCVSGRGWSAI